MAELTNTAAIDAWSNVSPEAVASFGDEGDFTRKYLLNSAIFEFAGDVAGKSVLDAGCGQGYLCRLLAKQGAVVTGVEPSDPWYTYARPTRASRAARYPLCPGRSLDMGHAARYL